MYSKDKVYIYDVYSYFGDGSTTSSNGLNNNSNNTPPILEPNLLSYQEDVPSQTTTTTATTTTPSKPFQHKVIHITDLKASANNINTGYSNNNDSNNTGYSNNNSSNNESNKISYSNSNNISYKDIPISSYQIHEKTINYTPDISSPPGINYVENVDDNDLDNCNNNNSNNNNNSSNNINSSPNLHFNTKLNISLNNKSNNSLLADQLNRYATGEFKGKDWNGEFQNLLSQSNSEQKFRKLSHLAKDFVFTAKSYATIIINELCIPIELKTIKPVDMGGFAGGLKYHCQGILFKFAMDTRLNHDCWMYGGKTARDDYAAKAASNELKGLISYYMTDVKGLNYPLMALIDYKGFRLIALSVLPISSDTIKYGSSDSGSVVHSEIPELNDKMKQVGEKLNLKAHRVGSIPENTKILSSPGDIEAHKGFDNRYYVIDFSRTFPPESISKQPNINKRCIFYNLLRPEFVSKWKKPLCSDAFSGWQRNDSEKSIHNKEIEEATYYLVNESVRSLANKFDQEKNGITNKLQSQSNNIINSSSNNNSSSNSNNSNNNNNNNNNSNNNNNNNNNLSTTPLQKVEEPSDFNQIKATFAVKFFPILQKRFEIGIPTVSDTLSGNTLGEIQSSINLLGSLDSTTSSSLSNNNNNNNNNSSTINSNINNSSISIFTNSIVGNSNATPTSPTTAITTTTTKDTSIDLKNKYRPLNQVKNEVPQQLLRIIEEMHRNGINIRHMGRVRYYTKSKTIRDLLLLEMTARSIKNIIKDEMRRKMKDEKGLSEEPFKEVVIEIFNQVLDQSSSFWIKVLDCIRVKYFMAFMKYDETLDQQQQVVPSLRSSSSSILSSTSSHYPIEEVDEQTWMENINIKNLLDRLQILTGISFSPGAQAEFSRDPFRFQFLDSDILEISPNVKHMNIIDYAEGMALLMSSLAKKGREKLRLLKMATQKFQISLKSNPDNFECLCQLGRTLGMQAETLALTTAIFGKNIYLNALEEATLKFIDALSINPKFSKAHYELAHVYILIAQYYSNNLYKSDKNYRLAAYHLGESITTFKQQQQQQTNSLSTSLSSSTTMADNEFYQTIFNDLTLLFFKGIEGASSNILGVSILCEELEKLCPDDPNLLILFGKSYIYRPFYDDPHHSKNNNNSSSFLKEYYYEEATKKFHKALLINNTLTNVVLEVGNDIWLKSKIGNRKLYYPAASIFKLLVNGNFCRENRVFSMYTDSLMEILKMEFSQPSPSSFFNNNNSNNSNDSSKNKNKQKNNIPIIITPISVDQQQTYKSIYLNETILLFEYLFSINNRYAIDKLESAFENQQGELCDFIKMANHSNIIKTKLLEYSKGVTKLSLKRSHVHDDDLNVIGQLFAQIVELDLSYCPLVSDQGLSDFLSNFGKQLITLILIGDLVGQKTISIISQFCQQIQYLDLNNCNLLDPESLVSLNELQKLKTLDLSKCRLTNETIQSWNKLNSLQTLRIRNQIRVTDECFYQFQSWNTLKVLDLSSCSKISETIFQYLPPKCLNLQEISLEACYHISDTTVISISNRMPNLVKLSLKNCKSITDESIRVLVQQCKSIKDLKLSRCHSLTDESVKLITENLHSTLERIDFSMCPEIKEESFINLLTKCTNIISVNLSENPKVSDRTIETINQHLPKIQHLKLDSCTKISVDGLNLTNTLEIQTLSIKKSQICHHTLCDLSITLLNLTSLTLKACLQLTDHSFAVIGQLSKLEYLDISDNYRLLDNSMILICKNLTKLKHLDISSCLRLTTKTFFLIGKFLSKIETLILTGCGNLTDSSLTYISENLLCLLSIDISGCLLITDKSIYSIANNQIHLESISLKDCKNISQNCIDYLKTKCPLFKIVRLSLHSMPLMGELPKSPASMLKETPQQFNPIKAAEWKQLEEDRRRQAEAKAKVQKKQDDEFEKLHRYEPFTTKYSFDFITSPNKNQKLDPSNLEKYLSDQDFVKYFQMKIESFESLPKWKRDDKKKSIGLF
ncbi:hypothetical protein CYY_008232 [Polysphondylium violaceum]|uniref:Clu domain-containing protein n=1 Tax=Polysphondylium violaceum TaxID=133409 RepID=A0A8J4PLZ3_9MYCE|nr:hypothetical protein CYY_008232 [Polysphondylium violaceum]